MNKEFDLIKELKKIDVNFFHKGFIGFINKSYVFAEVESTIYKYFPGFPAKERAAYAILITAKRTWGVWSIIDGKDYSWSGKNFNNSPLTREAISNVIKRCQKKTVDKYLKAIDMYEEINNILIDGKWIGERVSIKTGLKGSAGKKIGWIVGIKEINISTCLKYYLYKVLFSDRKFRDDGVGYYRNDELNHELNLY